MPQQATFARLVAAPSCLTCSCAGTKLGLLLGSRRPFARLRGNSDE
jgi:hypothetical protein